MTSGCGSRLSTASTRALCRATSSPTSRTHWSASLSAFNQANTILKSRDLGSIICDIKFSELTYLNAFWRDYINGSLLEALKGVFITDSLKQAVGHEAIKLLVNVDEEDYELGRQKLLRNLMLQALPWPFPLLTSLGTSHHPPLELTYCSGVCSLAFQLITPLPFFFLKEKTKEKWKWCPPPLPAPMCLASLCSPFPLTPSCVSLQSPCH